MTAQGGENRDAGAQRLSRLTVPRREADEKIARQVAKGKELLGERVGSQRELETARAAVQEWDDHSHDLLTDLFDSGEVAKEYGYSVGPVFVPADRKPLLTEEAERLRGNLRRKIDCLESIRGRLELYRTQAARGGAEE